jgi:hypothetical protein
VWSDEGPLRYERLTWPEVRRAAVPWPTTGSGGCCFLNGHGSNQNLVETAARLVMVERPEVLAAAALDLASPAAFEVRAAAAGHW